MKRQPIETAPRDGTVIRIYRPAHYIRAFWCNDLHDWVTDREYTINRVTRAKEWLPENSDDKR